VGLPQHLPSSSHAPQFRHTHVQHEARLSTLCVLRIIPDLHRAGSSCAPELRVGGRRTGAIIGIIKREELISAASQPFYDQPTTACSHTETTATFMCSHCSLLSFAACSIQYRSPNRLFPLEGPNPKN